VLRTTGLVNGHNGHKRGVQSSTWILLGMASSAGVLGLAMGVLVRAAMDRGAFVKLSTEDACEQKKTNDHINERSDQDDQEDHANGIIQTVNKEGRGQEKCSENPTKDRNSNGTGAERED